MCSKKIFITILSLFIMILAISCGKVPYNPFTELEGKYYVTKEADANSGEYTWIVFQNERLFQQYSASKTEKPTFTFSETEDMGFTFTASDDTTFIGKQDGGVGSGFDATLTLKFSSDRTTVSYSLVVEAGGERLEEEVYNLVN